MSDETTQEAAPELSAEDIAAAVGFLCSDQTGFITGQILGVNGGSVM